MQPATTSAFPLAAPVLITAGPHAGRTGRVVRVCGRVFADFRRIELDPRPRERTTKVEFVPVEALELLVAAAIVDAHATDATSDVAHPSELPPNGEAPESDTDRAPWMGQGDGGGDDGRQLDGVSGATSTTERPPADELAEDAQAPRVGVVTGTSWTPEARHYWVVCLGDVVARGFGTSPEDARARAQAAIPHVTALAQLSHR